MRQFHELFAGRDDVHGTYALSDASKTTEKGEKRTGKAKTVTGTVSKDVFEAHLSGHRSLGIVPIRLDGTVSWFAIDVDNYLKGDALHADLAKRINRHDLPLVIFRSKSGGAHLYCFLTEPMKAASAMTHAARYLKLLGLSPSTEVFPKQKEIADPDKQKGSWINLPYFGGERVCMGRDGSTELSLEEFLEYAHEKEVGPYDLGARGSGDTIEREPGEDRPPCIVSMEDDGVEEGGRDNAVFHFGVFARRAFPDDWQDKVMDFNDDKVHPSLPLADIRRIVTSLERHEYQYKCDTMPMCDLCDKATCITRKFGVGTGEARGAAGDAYVVNGIVKLMVEPPVYVVNVNGKEVRMDVQSLTSQKKFQQACMDQAGIWPPKMSANAWEAEIVRMNGITEVTDVSQNATALGLVQEAFMRWVRQTVRTDTKRKDAGVPMWDGKDIHFAYSHFVQFFDRNYGTIKKLDAQQIIVYLSNLGVDVSKDDATDWVYPVSEPWFEIETEKASI